MSLSVDSRISKRWRMIYVYSQSFYTLRHLVGYILRSTRWKINQRAPLYFNLARTCWMLIKAFNQTPIRSSVCLEEHTIMSRYPQELAMQKTDAGQGQRVGTPKINITCLNIRYPPTKPQCYSGRHSIPTISLTFSRKFRYRLHKSV